MEKRKSARVDASQDIKGKLVNVVSFVANDISLDGISLVSNLQPVIGSTYKIFLIRSRDNVQEEFEIEITRAAVVAYDMRKHAALRPGLLFSVGARFKNLSEKQKEFLTSYIKSKAGTGNEGFISRDKVKPGS